MSNLLWSDTFGTGQIDGPFLAYYNSATVHFSDWMLGISHTDGTYDSRFGYFTPKNLFSNLTGAITIEHPNKDVMIYSDRKIMGTLEKLRDELNRKAQELYSYLGYSGFREFKMAWEGQNINKNEVDMFWLNKNLDLLVGETQRIATDFNADATKQLIDLFSIELSKTRLGSLDNATRKKLTKLLSQTNFLYAYSTEQVSFLEEFSDRNSVTLSSRGFNDESFVNNMKQILDSDLSNKIDSYIKEQFSNFLSNLWSDKGVYGRLRKESNTKEVESPFIELKFKTNDKRIKKSTTIVAQQVQNYLAAARRVAFSDELNQRWNEYYSTNSKVFNNYIKKLCEDYFKTYGDNPAKFKKFFSRGSFLMGLFGELYSYGKSHFNLRNLSEKRQLQILNTGNLYNNKGRLLSTNMVIQVIDEQKGVKTKHDYGILVKNPFRTEKGLYETYRSKYDFTSKTLFKNFLEMDDDTKDEFIQLNLNLDNITNSTTAAALQQNIENFLYAYAPNFLRTNIEEVNEELTESANKDVLENSRTQNIFYVLKGEIMEAADIIDRLIAQYKYFLMVIDGIEESKNISNRVWKVTYKNNIKTEEKPYTSRYYEEEYVVKDKAINSLLKQISISTALNLQIPSFDSIKK